jgi:DNA-binding MurR/RpiR family transcriptional regulator
MTPATGSKRLRKEEAAITGLLTEPTIEAAAVKAGVSESTLVRWLQEPAFKAEYRAARRSVVESAVGRLQQAASQAVDALARNLSCGIPAVEVGAAKAVLDQAIKAVELIDLAERVESLEQASELAVEREKGTRR